MQTPWGGWHCLNIRLNSSLEMSLNPDRRVRAQLERNPSQQLLPALRDHGACGGSTGRSDLARLPKRNYSEVKEAHLPHNVLIAFSDRTAWPHQGLCCFIRFESSTAVHMTKQCSEPTSTQPGLNDQEHYITQGLACSIRACT